MPYKTNRVHWKQCKKDIKQIREKVFVCEFRIAPEQEFDQLDKDCEHVLLKDEANNVIATGRLCQSGKISRIAVLMKYRQTEAATQVVETLLAIAKDKGMEKIFIDSQLEDIHHYRAQGFEPVGQVFMQGGMAKQPLAGKLKQFNCQQSILH